MLRMGAAGRKKLRMLVQVENKLGMEEKRAK